MPARVVRLEEAAEPFLIYPQPKQVGSVDIVVDLEKFSKLSNVKVATG